MRNEKSYIKEQIKLHKKAIKDNNTTLIEMLQESHDRINDVNDLAIHMLKKQNAGLKIIIKALKEKLSKRRDL